MITSKTKNTVVQHVAKICHFSYM